MADKIVIEVVGNTAGLKSLTDEFNKTAKASDDLNKNLLETEKDAEKVDKAFKSLKTQIKEAKVEAQAMAEKFGASSREAIAAAQKVANLTDDLDDFNNRVKALNPEAKFNALNNVLSGTLGAFQGVTGAVQLFGGESKRAQEIAQKLQGALNFAQGLNSLLGMKDAFKDLSAVLGITNAATTASAVANQELAVAEGEAAVASNALNTSLLANPAFLIITGVVALGAALYAFSSDADEATIKVNELTEGQKALRDSTNETADAYDKMRLAMGGIDDFTAKRNALEREYNKQISDNDVEIQKANKSLKEQDVVYQALIKRKALSLSLPVGSSLVGPSDQELADAAEKLDKAQKDFESFTKRKEQIALAYNYNVQTIDKETTDAENEEAKKNAEKRKAEAEKALAEKKKAFQEEMNLIKLRQNNIVNDEKDASKKLELQQQFAVENYQLEQKFLEKNGGTANELGILWQQYYATRAGLSAQQDKAVKDSCDKELAEEEKLIAAKIALRLKEEADPVKQAQIEMDALDDKYAKILSNEKLTATERERINLEYLKAQLDISDKVTKAVVDSEKVKADAAKKSAEEQKKADEDRLKSAVETRDAIIGAAGDFAQIGADITRQQLDAETQALEEQKKKGIISEEVYQKKVNEIRRKQDIADKNAAIFQATLQFSQALINALTVTPSTAAPAALALAAAVAGANLAKIIATPLPKYNKGTLSVPGADHGFDSVHAMLRPGEAVIPTDINKRYAPTIKAIYEQKISASDINNFVRGKKTLSSGELVATVDTYALGRVMNKNRTVTVENAQTIGKVIANELGSKFNSRYVI